MHFGNEERQPRLVANGHVQRRLFGAEIWLSTTCIAVVVQQSMERDVTTSISANVVLAIDGQLYGFIYLLLLLHSLPWLIIWLSLQPGEYRGLG
jgi:hypothetical protein